MPKRKRSSKSKRTKRRRKHRSKTMRMVVRRNPLPATYKGTFKYYEEIALDPGVSGSPAVHVFTANGMYDPNITGIGHQPRGFDQLMSLYDHYVVIGAKITVQTENRCNCPLAFTVLVKDNQTALVDHEDIGEYKVAKSRLIGGENGTNSHSTIGTISMKLNPNKFLGRSKPLSDSQLKGSAGANPSEEVYFHIYTHPIDTTTDSPSCRARVWIQYTAVLLEPKNPSKS